MSQTEAPLSLAAPVRSDRPVDLLIIAGEHSGDQQAARLLRKLRAQAPELHVCAIGGEALAAEGAQLLFDLTAHSVVGLFEVLRHYGFFRRLFSETLGWIDQQRPCAVLFVDYPGFNLRLAEQLHQRGLSTRGGGDIRLLYYIGPQIWAWKAKRRFKMAQLLDALGVIFPFEVACYADTDLPVTFVGHPFMDAAYQLPLSYDPKAPILLLPGSRKAAVRRIFPIQLAAFARYLEKYPQAEANVIYPSSLILGLLQDALNGQPRKVVEAISFVPKEAQLAASAALTSSGTMSLNVALAGIPANIVYRANPLTYRVGRIVVDIRYLGIANLLLDRPVMPEYLQGDAKPGALAENLQTAIHTAAPRQQALAAAKEISHLLTAENTPAEQWLLQELGTPAGS